MVYSQELNVIFFFFFRLLSYDHCKKSNVVPLVNISALVEYSRTQADVGSIDSISYLRKARIWLYRGVHDGTYCNGSVALVKDFFKALGVPESQIVFNNTIPSNHCWPSDDYGGACGKSDTTIQNCGYDGPGEVLKHIYGNLLPRAKKYVESSLYPFDQTPFNSNTFHQDFLPPIV